MQTGKKVAKGKLWHRVCYVSEFPNWTAALQFEWRWKQLSRKYPMSMEPIERRLRALQCLVLLKQSTSKAILFDEWANVPLIHIESDEQICAIYLEDNGNLRFPLYP